MINIDSQTILSQAMNAGKKQYKNTKRPTRQSASFQSYGMAHNMVSQIYISNSYHISKNFLFMTTKNNCFVTPCI
tara:strand:+ start:348 stop:572 length:225 start_codon:yes stop_codon:yes gene_type:complete